MLQCSYFVLYYQGYSTKKWQWSIFLTWNLWKILVGSKPVWTMEFIKEVYYSFCIFLALHSCSFECIHGRSVSWASCVLPAVEWFVNACVGHQLGSAFPDVSPLKGGEFRLGPPAGPCCLGEWGLYFWEGCFISVLDACAGLIWWWVFFGVFYFALLLHTEEGWSTQSW